MSATSMGRRTMPKGRASACFKHGHKPGSGPSKTYKSWVDMVRRCKFTTGPNWRSYKGRGITVCDRWLKFENFLADMGEKPLGRFTIDRIDNNGNYEPKNCRWATYTDQNRNKRNNHLLTFNGKTMCIAEWAEAMGIERDRLKARIYMGWSTKRALETPIQDNKGESQGSSKLTTSQVLEIRKDKRSQNEIARVYGICQKNVSFIKRRVTWRHI